MGDSPTRAGNLKAITVVHNMNLEFDIKAKGGAS